MTEAFWAVKKLTLRVNFQFAFLRAQHTHYFFTYWKNLQMVEEINKKNFLGIDYRPREWSKNVPSAVWKEDLGVFIEIWVLI